MSYIKEKLKSIFKINNRPSVLFDERFVKLETDIEKILSPKDESQKNPISTTVAFQLLLQATSDAIGSREECIEGGLIADWMTTNESIASLFAQYVFIGFDKKISPILVGNLIKNYCIDTLFSAFSSYYVAISKVHGVEINLSIFDSDQFDAIMDIHGAANKMKSMDYKKHWIPPFKEPYKTQWESCF